MEEEVKESRSIVDASRRADMIGASDWVGEFMEETALTKGVGAKPAVEAQEAVTETRVDDDGNEVKVVVREAVKGKAGTKGKDVWDLDKMFILAEVNGIDTATDTFSRIRDNNAVGRARMTISNMLRARARRRHGLFDVEGEWVEAPAHFVEGHELTERPNGDKIAKPKAEKESDAEQASEETAAE